MTIAEMFAEWRKGCSEAPPESPEDCAECTRAFIDALEKKIHGLFTEADVKLCEDTANE